VASTSPFHLAFTVRDISDTRAFFGGLLGCTEGFVSDTRVDFDFFGNHLVAHLRRDTGPVSGSIQTDEQRIPLPHFGVILDLASWETLAERLRGQGGEVSPRAEGPRQGRSRASHHVLNRSLGEHLRIQGTQRSHARAVAGAPIERRNAMAAGAAPERAVNGRIVDTN